MSYKVKDPETGKEYEAVSLVLCKQYAQEIMKGEKTVEFRAVESDRNFSLFAETNEDGKWNFKRVRAIHFYVYNKSFELDVIIDANGVVSPCKKGVELMHQFGCNELDEEADKYEGVPLNKIPMYFWFHIAKIVKSRGLE